MQIEADAISLSENTPIFKPSVPTNPEDPPKPDRGKEFPLRTTSERPIPQKGRRIRTLKGQNKTLAANILVPQARVVGDEALHELDTHRILTHINRHPE